MSPNDWNIVNHWVGVFMVWGSNYPGYLNSAHVGNTDGVVRLSNFSL